MKVLLVKTAGTPVSGTRQRIMQVRSAGSWSGNLTSTELAGSQSEEDRLKHEAGWGRDGCDQDFTTLGLQSPSGVLGTSGNVLLPTLTSPSRMASEIKAIP